MLKVAQILLLIFLACYQCDTRAQSAGSSCKADSIQLFSLDKEEYHFSFTNMSQGLCFNNIIYETKPRIFAIIFNDTKDTIVNLFRERDAHIHWMRDGGRFDTIYPGQAMKLKGLATGGKFIGSMNSSYINLKFKIKDSIYTNIISVCGSIYPSDFKNSTLLTSVKNSIVDSIKPKINNTIQIDSNVSPYKLHYYDISGARIAIDTNRNLNYFCKLSEADRKFILSNGNQSKEFIDSIGKALKKYGASVKFAISDGYIVTCSREMSTKINQLLNNSLLLMISEDSYLQDKFYIHFNQDVSNERISEIMSELKISKFYLEEKNIYLIELQNSPSDNNNSLTNKLIQMKEVKKITQYFIYQDRIDD